MKKIKTTITSLKSISDFCKRLILAFEQSGNIDVVASKHSGSKTQAQTNLYHDWMRIMGDELGYDIEEMKHICKGMFMLSIYVRDDIQKYGNVAETMRSVKGKVTAIEYNDLKYTIVRAMSHLDLSVAQMAEYMRSVKLWAGTEMNIRLTEPSMRGWCD